MERYLSETDHWTDQTKVSRELAESNETGLAGILAILRPVFLDRPHAARQRWVVPSLLEYVLALSEELSLLHGLRIVFCDGGAMETIQDGSMITIVAEGPEQGSILLL